MRLVVVVERAERLIPELMVPLTRLAELVSSSTLSAQLTFFWQARVDLCVVFVSESHERRYDHRWARRPTRISLTFLRQREKVSLREKYFLKVTHLFFTDIVKHSNSKYSSHLPSNPSTRTISLPSARSVTHSPMTLMSQRTSQLRKGRGLSSQHWPPINATWTWTRTRALKRHSNPPPKKPACASAVYSFPPKFLSPSTPASKMPQTRQRQMNHHQTSSTTHQPSQKPWYPPTRKTPVLSPCNDAPWVSKFGAWCDIVVTV